VPDSGSTALMLMASIALMSALWRRKAVVSIG